MRTMTKDAMKLLKLPANKRVSPKHIAALTGFGKSTVLRWASGESLRPAMLPEPVKVGGRWYWVRADIEKLFSKARVKEVMDAE